MRTFKKVTSLMVAIFMFATMSVFAIDTGSINVTMVSPESEVEVGDTVEIPVNVSTINGLSGYNLAVKWDPKLLDMSTDTTLDMTTFQQVPVGYTISVQATNIFKTMSNVDMSNVKSEGLWKWAAAAEPPMAVDMGITLVTLKFTVLADAAGKSVPVEFVVYDDKGDLYTSYSINSALTLFGQTAGAVVTVAGGEEDPTAESIGLKTDDTQILRLKDVKVNNNNGESYTVNTALGFVSCVNKDANATDLYTQINLEGWAGAPLDINAKNTTEIGDKIYFVAAVTSIREANLNKAFSAKAFATVDGKPVTDSNTVSATYNVQ